MPKPLSTILAGFHTDLNFLTIHGRSRYPGLNIWARNTGKRIPVKFPPTGRYLLVQAGKQLEHITGGLIKAGYHEVVVNDSTLEVISVPFNRLHSSSIHLRGFPQAIERRKQTHPDRPRIRISSTFFYHLSSDYDLTPIAPLAERAKVLRGETDYALDQTDYPAMKVGQQVQK